MARSSAESQPTTEEGKNVITNQFKVPQSQWRKWGDPARNAFNWLYDLMMNQPSLFNHPKALKQEPKHWKTVAWNSAWLAADAVKDAVKAVTPKKQKCR
jgi:hypothetical protein